jgi:hypothetical protein
MPRKLKLRKGEKPIVNFTDMPSGSTPGRLLLIPGWWMSSPILSTIFDVGVLKATL